MRQHLRNIVVAVVLVGCGDATQLATLRPSTTSVTRVVVVGTVDTLQLSDSIFAIVDNRQGSVDGRFELTTMDTSGIVPADMARGGAVLRVDPITSGGAGAHLSDGGTAAVQVVVEQSAPTTPGLRSVGILDMQSRGAVPFWTSSTQSTYVDPRTGVTHAVDIATLQPTLTATTDELVEFVDPQTTCNIPPSITDADDGLAAPDAIPLLLIHGWDWNVTNCLLYALLDPPTNRDPFGPLLDNLRLDPDLRSRYHVYVMHYRTFFPVLDAAAYLRDALPQLPGGAPVIVAHSMGGLVARAMLDYPNPPAIRGLITIATPHDGAPVASVVSGTTRLAAQDYFNINAICPGHWSDEFVTSLGTFVSPIFASLGLRDLRPESDLIQLLRANHADSTRIFTIGVLSRRRPEG